MSIQYSHGKCKRCGDVAKIRQGTNHILHLLLVLVSMGLWLPIWLLASIRIGGWRCFQCGRRI